jgi:hypothetical protein
MQKSPAVSCIGARDVQCINCWHLLWGSTFVAGLIRAMLSVSQLGPSVSWFGQVQYKETCAVPYSCLCRDVQGVLARVLKEGRLSRAPLISIGLTCS